MTTKTLTGIVLAAVQLARATETGNLGIRVLPPRQRNKGFATGFALAFILVITLGGTWEVMGAERPRVEFSNPALQVNTYDFAEIVIRVTDPDVANPFTDASVQDQFVHEGSAPVRVDGFCDSTDGSVFRIRFMPSRPGRHEYSVTYRQQGLERTQTGSLNGWDGDHTIWSVRDGAITGQTTAKTGLKENNFLTWKDQVENFELRLKFRIDGGNSGIYYRANKRRAGKTGGDPLVGTQADFDASGRWTGVIMEYLLRGVLAERGQKVVIDEQGRKEITPLADPAQLLAAVKAKDWNHYTVLAKGGSVVLKINGVAMCELDDRDPKRLVHGYPLTDHSFYVRTTLHSDTDRKTTLRLGLDNWAIVWLNGTQIEMRDHAEEFETAHIPISLRKGDNCLVIKTNNRQNGERLLWAINCAVE